MLKVTVDRSKWYRGQGSTGSMLKRASDGHMCCLGFVCLADGYTEDEITNVSSPGDITGIVHDDGEGVVADKLVARYDDDGRLYVEDSSACNEMMSINDDNDVEDERREALLTELAKGIDIELVFVDTVAPALGIEPS